MATDKVMLDIAVKLDLETAKLNKKTDEVNRRLARMDKQGSAHLNALRNNFFKIAAAATAFYGAIKGGEKILKSTQGSGDALENTLTGIKTGFENVMENVSRFDLTNLVDEFIRGYTAGKEFSAAMDEISDRVRSVSIQNAEAELEINRLRSEREQQITDKDYQAALDHTARILQLSQEMSDKEEKLLTRRLTAWRDKMKTKEGIFDEDVKLVEDYIKNYNVLSDELAVIDEYLKLEAFGRSPTTTVVPGQVKAQKVYNVAEIKAAKVEAQKMLSTFSESQLAYLRLDEVIQNLVDEERDYYAEILKTSFGLQKRAIAFSVEAGSRKRSLETSIDKEKELAEKTEEEAKQRKNTYDWTKRQLSLLEKMYKIETPDTNWLDLDAMDAELDRMLADDEANGLFDAVDFEKYTGAQFFENFMKDIAATENMIRGLENAFSGMFDLISQAVEDGGAGWTSYALMAIEAIEGVINALLAEAVALAIKGSLKTGPWGLIAGLAAAGTVLSVGKGLINKARNSYTDGGIVPGNSYSGDNVPAWLNSKEMVLNGGQQAKLFKIINTGGIGGNAAWETANVEIGYDKLIIGMQKGIKMRNNY